MSETATPPAAAPETPAAETPEFRRPPAVATPPVTVKSPEEIVRAITDKVKGDIKAAQPKSPEEKKPEAGGKPTIDTKMTRELGRLQARVRELEPQLKDFEGFKADAGGMREIRELWGKGDFEGALAKLSGKDGLDTIAEVVAKFYAKEQKSGTDGKAAPSPEMKAMLDEIKGLRATVDELRNSKKAADEKTAADSAAENMKQANDYARRQMEKIKTELPVSMREANIAEALDLAHAAAIKIAKRDYGEKKLTNEEADAVYAEALRETEAEFVATGKRFAAAETKMEGFDPNRYRVPLRTPPVKTEPGLRKGASTNEVLEHYRRRAANGEFRR